MTINMARSKKKQVEIKHERFETVCCYCGKKYISNTQNGIKEKCCGHKLIINNHQKLLSRYKEELNVQA